MALISPYHGRLVDLVVSSAERPELVRYAATLPSIQISARSQCDLELLATGAFSPLDRFMSQRDYESVVGDMRLANGVLFPIPVTLPLGDGESVAIGRDIALRSAKNDILAILSVDEIFECDRSREAASVLGTTDRKHPLVAEMERWGSRSVSGRLRVLSLPTAYDFRDLRRTPAEVRKALTLLQHDNVVAFQTRNPMHRAHEELTKRAIAQIDGALLLHPAVGMTRPGDVDHFTRVRTYRALIDNYYPPDRVLLSLIPLAMRLAGPREALWHAIIRRNYGANHFIVGRDHASPGRDSAGRPFYGALDAQELLARHSDEIGVRMIPFSELVYLVDEDRYEESSRLTAGAATRSISGTEVRDRFLAEGVPLPSWFTRPEVAAILAAAHPRKDQQGFCVWFTGLPSSGKSTIAEIVVSRLLEHGRQSTLLDGDVVRTHLSKGLGFSKDDRDTNILRIGFVAAEIVRHRGVAVCAAVSPYRETRDAVRSMVGSDHFIEVFVDTPLEICESRDSKGLYAAARRGSVANFTGVSDPYQAPLVPEIRLEPTSGGAEKSAAAVLEYLESAGFLSNLSRVRD